MGVGVGAGGGCHALGERGGGMDELIARAKKLVSYATLANLQLQQSMLPDADADAGWIRLAVFNGGLGRGH